jgi:hypothetical protein
MAIKAQLLVLPRATRRLFVFTFAIQPVFPNRSSTGYVNDTDSLTANLRKSTRFTLFGC